MTPTRPLPDLLARVHRHRARRQLWRWAQLLAGLAAFALAIALMIRSELGLGPWDAFHLGIHRWTGMSVGTASIVVGLLIVAGTTAMGLRPGAGTLANMVLIGLFLDALLPLVPTAAGWPGATLYYLAGIALAGLATGMYIAPGLGKGPRDGLMLVLSQKSGWPVRRVRLLLELSVLGLGWAMGGTIGVGTVLFTLLIGPAAQLGLQLFGALPPAPPLPLVRTAARRRAPRRAPRRPRSQV